MKKFNCKKQTSIIIICVVFLILFVLAWVLFICLGNFKEKEYFRQMYPNTDDYLQEVYGKYYKKSNVLIRGKVTVIFYIDEGFFKNSEDIEINIEGILTDEANTLYQQLLHDCNGEVKHLEIIFFTYKYNGKYYNFAYQKPMKKTDEMFFWPIS